MFSVEIVLLGLALAIDAAVVTFAIGLIHLELSQAGKLKSGLLISLTFGLFQTMMIWLGSYTGFLFSYSKYGFYFRLIVGVIFLGLSVKCVQESFNQEEKKIKWDIFPIIILSFATSIDAFAAGIGLGTLPQPILAATEVGVITFLTCGLFYLFSQFLSQIPDRWLLRGAAMIFLFLGGDIFWGYKHLFFKG